MQTTRPSFLKTAAVANLAEANNSRALEQQTMHEEELARIANQPVLDMSFVRQPVKIASIELLHNGPTFLIRTRSTDGVEAVTVPHPAKMAVLSPIFLRHTAPFFIGKDARELERLLWEVYRHDSNYKLQGLALWVCVAAIEMSLLELMGRAVQRPLADFFGGQKKRDIPIYVASNNRGNTPEAEIEHLQKLVHESGAQALKFRLGGRMSRNADSLPGRTETLIVKAREVFGEAMTLYGDANSSYEPGEAIRIGRLMEAHCYAFYEEPCEFDDLWGTKRVADALTIPVALGEQEFSLHRWRWMIANRVVDIVQPDLHYGGGFIRATKVARMAAAAGMAVVPHMSGGGLSYVDVVHFASFTPNIGAFMEFKGNTALPIQCETSPLKSVKGVVSCPTGAGWGVEIDPEFVAKAVPVVK